MTPFKKLKFVEVTFFPHRMINEININININFHKNFTNRIFLLENNINIFILPISS